MRKNMITAPSTNPEIKDRNRLSSFIKKMLPLFVLFVYALIPTSALAVNITVPSAPGAGYALISTTTGAYVATGTPWFLRGFGFSNATGTSATTTNFFSTTASTTNLFGTLINGFGLGTCNTTNAITWTAGSFGCLAIPQGTVTSVTGTANRITSTGGATPQIDISGSYVGQSSITTIGTLSSGAVPASLVTAGTFGSGNYIFPAFLTVLGSTTLQNFTATNGTTSQATSTGFYATTIGTNNEYFTDLTGSGLNNTAGALTCNTASSAVFGCLATTDWTNFNNKVSSSSLSGATVISYTPSTGVITTVGGTFGAGNYVFPSGLTVTNTATTSNLYVSGSSTLQSFTFTIATGTSATTTNFASTNASTTNLFVSSAGGGTAGCATFSALGLISNTGTACGSGGGTTNTDEWATATLPVLSIYPNSTGSVSIGTSTASLSTLTLASSTKSQLTLTDGSLGSTQISMRDAGGNFYLATSSPSTFSTSTNTSFSILPGGLAGFVGIGTSTPIKPLYVFGETSGGIATFHRRTTLTTGNIGIPIFLAESTGQMTDGFGTGLNLQVEDADGVANTLGTIFAVRDGADNTGKLTFQSAFSGVLATLSTMRNSNQGIWGVGTTTPVGTVNIVSGSGSDLSQLYPQLVLTDFGGGTNLKHIYASSSKGELTFGSINDSLSTISSPWFRLSVAGSTTTNATTTSFTTTNASATNFWLSSAGGSTQCLHTDSTGKVTGTGSDCGSGGGGTNTDKFATTSSTLNPNAIYVNGGNNTLVGIGTSTPAGAMLDIASSSGFQLALSDGSLTSNQIGFRNYGGVFNISSSSPSTFSSSTATLFAIDSNAGQVAIGTSTFLGGLNIDLANTNINLNSGTTFQDRNGNTAGTNGISFDGYNSVTGRNAVAGTDSMTFTTRKLTSGNALQFNTRTTGGGTISTMTLQNLTGNIGMGTSTPQWTLDVSSSTRSQITLSDSSLTSNHWSFRNTGGTFYLATSSPSTFATSTTPALTINANGYLGIASSSPTSALSVNGDVYVNGRYFQFGSSAPNFKCAEAVCLEVGGSDNSTAGTGYNSYNTNSGTSAYTGYTLSNDKSNSNIVNFGGMFLNSYPYSDTSFGTAWGHGSAMGIQNSMGRLMLMASTSTLPSEALINFFTGGTTDGVGPTGNERMRIDSNGRLLIGTTTTQTTAGLMTIATGTIPQLTLTDGSLTANQWNIRSVGGNLYFATSSAATQATTTQAAITVLGGTVLPSLDVGTTSPATYGILNISPQAGQTMALSIGSSTKSLLQLDVNGSMYAPSTGSSGASQTGYWCYDANGQFIRDSAVCLVSALKFKKDVQPLTVGLAELMKLKPVSYMKKDPLDAEDSHTQMGFIADDVAKIPALNEMLVTYDQNGDVHGFRYEQFTALLTKSIQELAVQVQGVKRSAEENYQWIFIGLLALGMTYQQVQIRKLKQ